MAGTSSSLLRKRDANKGNIPLLLGGLLDTGEAAALLIVCRDDEKGLAVVTMHPF